MMEGSHALMPTTNWHQLDQHYGGWLPSLPDQRRRRADTSGITVLPEVDPRDMMPAVFNQWALGACTIHADIAAFMYDQILDGASDPEMLCRLAGYWLERQKEGMLGQGDTGAYGSDGFWVAQKVGLPPETVWPYEWAGQQDGMAPDTSVFDPPELPPEVVAQEGFYKLTKPYASPPLTQLNMQQVLSNKQTISFGFTVYESFESSEVARSGLVPMPGADEKPLGGHQVLLVGYLKDYPLHGLLRNSWDLTWGIGGYFLMPWQYITDPNLSGDWKTIQRPIGK